MLYVYNKQCSNHLRKLTNVFAKAYTSARQSELNSTYDLNGTSVQFVQLKPIALDRRHM